MLELSVEKARTLTQKAVIVRRPYPGLFGNPMRPAVLADSVGPELFYLPSVGFAPILRKMKEADNIRYVTRNRKARHNYTILSSLEAGIELKGAEVKSIREGKISLSDSYAVVEGNEVLLKNLHITPYEMAADSPLDPLRTRRLLLHAREIRKLRIETEQKGRTLIPLAIYFKGKLAKVELGLAVGRKKYDKRQAIAEAEASKRIKRALKKDY